MWEKLLNGGLVLRPLYSVGDVSKCAEFNAVYNNAFEGKTYELLHTRHPALRLHESYMVENMASGEVLATACLIPWVIDFDGVKIKTAQLEMVLSHPDYRGQGLIRNLIAAFTDGLQSGAHGGLQGGHRSSAQGGLRGGLPDDLPDGDMQGGHRSSAQGGLWGGLPDDLPDGGYDLSVIWGIPYFYRQFGYSYCLYGNEYHTLPANRVPDIAQYNESEAVSRIVSDIAPEIAGGGYIRGLRKAVRADIPVLTAFYNEAAFGAQLRAVRDEAYWKYLLEDAGHPIRIVEDTNGGAAGYITCAVSGGGTAHAAANNETTAHIVESSIGDNGLALSVLRALKNEGHREIRVCGPEGSAFFSIAQSLGSIPSKREQWLMRVTDIVSFIDKIVPVLNRRLTDSDCADYTGELIINLYRRAYKLSFTDGRLGAVEDVGFRDSSMGKDGGDLCIPQDAFIRLLFGFRTLDQLSDAWPDIEVKPAIRHLIDVLFPSIKANLYLPYHNIGG